MHLGFRLCDVRHANAGSTSSCSVTAMLIMLSNNELNIGAVAAWLRCKGCGDA
jgi:hypothetical protein